MRVLFARIGYMKFYTGSKPEDERPIGGGAYNIDNIGHEVNNFLNVNGKVYGYFQPNMNSSTIDLSKIEHGVEGDKIDKVLLIWIATDPVYGGQVIVGWHSNATIYRTDKKLKDSKGSKNRHYYTSANYNNAVLLPTNRRKFKLGNLKAKNKKGVPGQSNTFYILDENGNEKSKVAKESAWIKNAIDYVKNYNGPRLETSVDEMVEESLNTNNFVHGQGFQSDVELRLKIEHYAMQSCERHFKKLGFNVLDVSATESYDFIIEKMGRKYFVEVKGTQGRGDIINLTKNEVKLSKKLGNKMKLYILHSIKISRKNIQNGSGEAIIVDPWKINSRKLTPITYAYSL